MNKYIITGGPGTGKTSVIECLAQKGIKTIPEVARSIIAEEQSKARVIPGYVPILPSTDLELFEERCIQRQLAQEVNLVQSHDYFLDRSLVDPIAYAELAKVRLQPDLDDLLRDADYRAVFFLEQLPQYVKDTERSEDAVQAQRLHYKLYDVYDRWGYDIIPVPVFPGSLEESIAQRADYILRHTQRLPFMEIEKKYLVSH
ncbi:MAG: ATP-binding protein, partial [Candidatus Omnitrophota bacterium]|nr:ATP-binding protein [Candidatus Omnitrophota bacterium]